MHIWYNLLQSTQLLLLSIQCPRYKSRGHLLVPQNVLPRKPRTKSAHWRGRVQAYRPPIQDEVKDQRQHPQSSVPQSLAWDTLPGGGERCAAQFGLPGWLSSPRTLCSLGIVVILLMMDRSNLTLIFWQTADQAQGTPPPTPTEHWPHVTTPA